MTKSKPRDEDLPYRPCVGIVVVNREGLVWTGRRLYEDKGEFAATDHVWQMPQGGIDKGEDPETAAYRELYEETSIRSVSLIAQSRGWINYDLPPDLIGTAWKGRYRGQTQKWFALRFTGEDGEIDVLNPGGGTHKAEFGAWKWMPLDELTRHVVPFKREVYETVVAEFADIVR